MEKYPSDLCKHNPTEGEKEQNPERAIENSVCQQRAVARVHALQLGAKPSHHKYHITYHCNKTMSPQVDGPAPTNKSSMVDPSCSNFTASNPHI
jgi:hypothetical protein